MTIRDEKGVAKVRSSYDALAEEYAKHVANELDHRPQERDLLRRFAERHRGHGVVCDLGCGPGHIARYLRQFGADTIGLDLSWGTLAHAKLRNPEILFAQGDMLELPFASEKLSGLLAFYSIIHFHGRQVDQALAEMRRVLRKNGDLLLGVHIGNGVVHADQMFGVRVDLDAHFFTMEDLVGRLNKLGLTVVEKLQRGPLPEVEYQSIRGYLWATKSS